MNDSSKAYSRRSQKHSDAGSPAIAGIRAAPYSARPNVCFHQSMRYSRSKKMLLELSTDSDLQHRHVWKSWRTTPRTGKMSDEAPFASDFRLNPPASQGSGAGRRSLTFEIEGTPMANGKLLRQLVKAGAEGDPEAFRRASEAVISEERGKQHHLLANDLEKLLYGRPQPLKTPALFSLSKAIPSDKERGLDLIDLRQPVRQLSDLIVSDSIQSSLDEILMEHNRADVLASHGVEPAGKLLFFGPPGCGKTLAAEVLATELSLPLATVRIDSVVSSYLGETAANLRKVFDFLSERPVVALFDEFDAVAKDRADSGDHGELKRVVNAFLQMMDAYTGKSLIVAATNHETLLDSAIWRRFDETVCFEKPNLEQLKRLLTAKLRGVRRNVEPADIANLFKGMAHADVERVLRRAVKEMILQGREFLEQKHIDSALQREVKRS